MTAITLQASVIIFAAISTQISLSSALHCEHVQFPPNSSLDLPSYTVNLDLHPSQRWNQLAKDKSKYMSAIFEDVKEIIRRILPDRIFYFMMNQLSKIAETLPSQYYEELKGISEAADLPLPYVTMYNIFYESFALCTSIIVQDTGGDVYLGRNLDNGAFLGWDVKNHTWLVTEQLKHLAVHLKWERNGSIVFESIGFAGYIGVLTAVKHNAFSFSLNKRMSWNNGLVGLFEWFVWGDHNQHWVSLLPREVLEDATSYEEAKQILSSDRLLAPVYYMLAGVEKGQGTIITRYRDNANILSLGDAAANNPPWFLVQTNYDHWAKPFFFDNRRDPAKKCLVKGRGILPFNSSVKDEGRYGTGNNILQLLADVLSTMPVLNKNTVYAALMNARTGHLTSWRQNCESKLCPPF